MLPFLPQATYKKAEPDQQWPLFVCPVRLSGSNFFFTRCVQKKFVSVGSILRLRVLIPPSPSLDTVCAKMQRFCPRLNPPPPAEDTANGASVVLPSAVVSPGVVGPSPNQEAAETAPSRVFALSPVRRHRSLAPSDLSGRAAAASARGWRARKRVPEALPWQPLSTAHFLLVPS